MIKEQTLRRILGRMVFAILLLAGTARGQNLFLAGTSSNDALTIDEFINDNGTLNSNVTVFAPVSGGNPWGLAFNSAGDLFAAERGSDIIQEITPAGATNTFATIDSGALTNLNYAEGMAFDQSGNLFAASAQDPVAIYEISPAGVVSVFVSPVRTVLLIGLAFDRSDDLFVASGGDIIEFTNNLGTLSTNVTIFVSGLHSLTGLAFDAAGDLFASSENSISDPIYEFTNYQGTLSSNATIFASEPNFPFGMTFDSAGDMFVKVGNGPESIVEITPSGVQTTFATGLAFDVTYLAFQPVPTLQGVATNGTFQITVSIPSPYYTTILQSSADLVNWCNLCTNTSPFTFTDSLAASSRFYRAVVDTNFY